MIVVTKIFFWFGKCFRHSSRCLCEGEQMCDLQVRDSRTLKPIGEKTGATRQEAPAPSRFRRPTALELHMADRGLTSGPVADREVERWLRAQPD